MVIFWTKDKEYRGATALDVVRALESETSDYPYREKSVRRFLLWSLDQLSGQIPPRELHLSGTLEDEALALNYLYLRDEYGAGNLHIGPESS